MNDLFTKLFKRYYDDIYRLIYTSLLNVQDVEDVLQKTFTKLYLNIDKFDNDYDYAKRWLCKVAINEANDLLSSSWNKKTTSFNQYENSLKAKSKSSHNELKNLMSSIKDSYRIPLYLYYYEGYNIKEISEIMKMSESCIKSRLSRGKKILKEEMEKKYD